MLVSRDLQKTASKKAEKLMLVTPSIDSGGGGGSSNDNALITVDADAYPMITLSAADSETRQLQDQQQLSSAVAEQSDR